MGKIAAKNVSNGMLFEVISHDSTLNLGFKDGGMYFGGKDINPSIGTKIEIVKKPYKDNGVQFVDWKIIGSSEIWSSHWITFKTNTTYLSGTITPTTPVTVTSKGSFAGFDVEVFETKFEEYDSLGFNNITIRFDFKGSFTGGKKVNTKLINQIKTSPGFKKHLIDLIDKEIAKNKPKIDNMIKKINPSASSYFKSTYDNQKIIFWYSGGKLDLSINIMDDLPKIKSEINKQIDCFIALKKTNVGFLETK